jgi:hypothetical protein
LDKLSILIEGGASYTDLQARRQAGQDAKRATGAQSRPAPSPPAAAGIEIMTAFLGHRG